MVALSTRVPHNFGHHGLPSCEVALVDGIIRHAMVDNAFPIAEELDQQLAGFSQAMVTAIQVDVDINKTTLDAGTLEEFRRSVADQDAHTTSLRYG